MDPRNFASQIRQVSTYSRGFEAEIVTGAVLGNHIVDKKQQKVTALRTESVKAKMVLARDQIECILTKKQNVFG